MGKSIANIIWQGGRYTFATLFSFLISVFWPLVILALPSPPRSKPALWLFGF